MPAFNSVSNQSVASGVTFTKDLDTRRVRRMTVAWKLAGTVTAADLSNNDAFPFVSADPASGTAPLTIALPSSATAPAASGADVVAMKVYDLTGVEKVRLTAKNNNVGALNLSIDVFQEMLV